jgi:hypothetical protein
LASKAFTDAIASLKETKNLDSLLVGGPSLREGPHDVTILAVDTSGVDDNKLSVTYGTADGSSFTDRIFTMDKSGKGFSFSLRQLWSGVLADPEAIFKLVELQADDNHAIEMITGAKLRITLEQGPGLQARATSLGKYAAFDPKTNESQTPEFDSLKEVSEYCKANALQRSFLRVARSECTHKDENLAAFWKAAEEFVKPKIKTVSRTV